MVNANGKNVNNQRRKGAGDPSGGQWVSGNFGKEVVESPLSGVNADVLSRPEGGAKSEDSLGLDSMAPKFENAVKLTWEKIENDGLTDENREDFLVAVKALKRVYADAGKESSAFWRMLCNKAINSGELALDEVQTNIRMTDEALKHFRMADLILDALPDGPHAWEVEGLLWDISQEMELVEGNVPKDVRRRGCNDCGWLHAKGDECGPGKDWLDNVDLDRR